MTGPFIHKSLSTMVDDIISESRGIAPRIASRVIPKEDYRKWKEWQDSGGDFKDKPYGLHTYRVDGWYCPRTPPKETGDWKRDMLSKILWDTAQENEKMRPCSRKDATHVAASGVSGLLRPIEDVVVLGMVNWSPEQIKDAENDWNFRIAHGD